MTILQKLKKIEEAKRLYNICFRKAGVALQFYDQSRIKKPVWARHTRSTARYCNIPLDKLLPANWKEGLYVEHYYPSFRKAINAEFERL